MKSGKKNHIISDVLQLDVACMAHDEQDIFDDIILPIVSYYENIIGSMPGNVYWMDKQCKTIGCNKNVLDMLGLKSQEAFRGMGFEGMARIGKWSCDAALTFQKDTLEVMQTGLPKLNIEEPPIPHHDGRNIYFLTNRVPLIDATGQVVGVVGISFDITDRKLAELQLRGALSQVKTLSKAKSDFIANMSHDVKTPLSGIIGMSEVLTQRLTHPESLECVRAIWIAGQQLMNLFDNCIAIANSENSHLTLSKEHFSLRTLLTQLSQLFQPSIAIRKLDFLVSCDESIPEYVLGCQAGIYRILLNLIGNAVKFTHTGRIRVRLTASEKSTPQQLILKIVVDDTGIGIPKDKQKVIFEHFTRLAPSWQGIYEGNGIGLYVVNQFVKTMRGEIHIRSEQGRGSRFVVILPLEIPLLAPAEYASENLTEPSKHPAFLPVNTPFLPVCRPFFPKDSKHRVLLVEDNPVAQKVAVALLASLDCQTDVAESGKHALTLFDPGKYDLILMDIGLPDFPGHMVAELTRRIEQQLGMPGVPIVALTAHINDSTQKDCHAAGIDAVLEKPLSLEKGRRIIARHIQNLKATAAS